MPFLIIVVISFVAAASNVACSKLNQKQTMVNRCGTDFDPLSPINNIELSVLAFIRTPKARDLQQARRRADVEIDRARQRLSCK